MHFTHFTADFENEDLTIRYICYEIHAVHMADYVMKYNQIKFNCRYAF